MSKLLREYIAFPYDKAIIAEAKEKKQPIILQGVLQRADTENQNKRVYGRDILEREINNYQKAVQEGRAVGELDHPDSSVVELQNVSHIVRELWWDKNEVMGKVEILNTPKGKIVQDLMEAGVKIGISSRGVGETTKTNEGVDVVNDDFLIIRVGYCKRTEHTESGG